MGAPQWPLKTSHTLAVHSLQLVPKHGVTMNLKHLKHPSPACADSHVFASIGGLVSLLQSFHLLTHLMKCGLYSNICSNPVLNSQLPAFFIFINSNLHIKFVLCL